MSLVAPLQDAGWILFETDWQRENELLSWMVSCVSRPAAIATEKDPNLPRIGSAVRTTSKCFPPTLDPPPQHCRFQWSASLGHVKHRRHSCWDKL